LPGTSVTFTANIINGGPRPALLWKKNGSNVYSSSSSNTYTTSALSEGDAISCEVTTSYCAPNPVQLSNIIVMSVPSYVKQINNDAEFSMQPNPAKNELIIKHSSHVATSTLHQGSLWKGMAPKSDFKYNG
jgi:hypothetical protein